MMGWSGGNNATPWSPGAHVKWRIVYITTKWMAGALQGTTEPFHPKIKHTLTYMECRHFFGGSGISTALPHA